MKNKWQACYADEQVKYQMKMAKHEMAKERAADSDKKSEPVCPPKDGAKNAGRKGKDGINKRVAAMESATESRDDTVLMNA